MAADGATLCSARIGPQKGRKNLRECCQYLKDNRIDRTQFWRKVGNVLVCDLEALEQQMEEKAGQRSQKGSVIGYCSCGAAYPPRVKRGGDRKARRQRQRVNRGRSRDDRVVSSALARALNPAKGGSVPRNTETPSKLQLLQRFTVAGSAEGSSIRSDKDQAIYVGISHPTDRLAKSDEEKSVKTQKKERKVEDGLLLVVSASIYGKQVRALIDSGATRCFVTPTCVTAVGLKGTPRDVFLELGNGEKYLSRGYVPEVPVVTAGLTVKIGLTVTNLLHEVDLVLGINWLQLVNPVVDWSGARLYVPNAVHTALLQGNWLEGHVHAGTVTVLSSEMELQQMKNAAVQEKISILKCPKFWRIKTNDTVNSRANSFKKGEKNEQYEEEWGYLYHTDCQFCKDKNGCKENCKHRSCCKLFVIKTDEGVVRIKRVNKNAKLPFRGTEGAAGYDLAAAQSAVVPAHGKVLVKTGLAMALPPGCYGRIAPRSGLALKKFIDVGAGVIDSDYRGELGVILFNFGNEDFVVNQGDKVAQLIFEKIKTPTVKEVDSLEGTGRGDRGYGSTGISGSQSNQFKTSRPSQDSNSDQAVKTQ